MSARALTLSFDQQTISALYLEGDSAHACYVFAHGAGAGMHHRSMSDMAERLARHGVATLRYQFPYMERGSKRPDAPPMCHAAVRAAVDEARRLTPALPVFAGGRSFGGRMTSQAQSLGLLPDLRGIAFLAFPLHPAGKPSMERAEHLQQVSVPMLFVQGTRDELAELPLLESVIRSLGVRAQLKLLEDADHSFHVPARSGRTDAQVADCAAQALAQWFSAVCR